MKKTWAVLFSLLLILGCAYWLAAHQPKTEKPSTTTTTKKTTPEPEPKQQAITPTTETFNKEQYSTSNSASIWVIVNKKRSLNPKNYAPTDLVNPKIALRIGAGNQEMFLRAEAAAALESLATAAKSEANLTLMLASGYRSYDFQRGLYDRYVQQQGQAVADTQSARPGHSEHQTGLAADVEPGNRSCEIEDCFAGTAEGKWVATNAHRFGFIIRYPASKQEITGYKYEPWHLRYVGKSLSTELQKQNVQTLEEFFTTGPANSY